MTRLEKQIIEMEERVELFKSFSNTKMNHFLTTLPVLQKVLKSYKITEIDFSNSFVDEVGLVEKKLSLRIYIIADLSNLSELQKRNLEKKLRCIVPMPICPINSRQINIVYHD